MFKFETSRDPDEIEHLPQNHVCFLPGFIVDQQHTFRTLILRTGSPLVYVYTASIILSLKQAWIYFLTVQVAWHIWTNGTQGRYKMRRLAVPDVEIMSTMNYALKSMSTFYSQCRHTCWVVGWTEVQSLAGRDITDDVFYCTAICGRRAKDIVHPLVKISACCWSISLLQ